MQMKSSVYPDGPVLSVDRGARIGKCFEERFDASEWPFKQTRFRLGPGHVDFGASVWLRGEGGCSIEGGTGGQQQCSADSRLLQSIYALLE